MRRSARWLLPLLLGVGAVACDGCEEEEGPEPTVEIEPPEAPTTPPTEPPDEAPKVERWVPPWKEGPPPDAWKEAKRWNGTLEEQNGHLFSQIIHVHGLDDAQLDALRARFAASDRLGQGNPEAARHPVTVAECRKKLVEENIDYDALDHDERCRARYMVPLYDPESEKPEDARACIDMFEFPNIPCAYPVTWVRANEAAALCEAVGKRLCDAHEWEGGCYGKLLSVEESYNFGLIERMDVEDAIKGMRAQQNIKNHDDRRWAYGEKYQKGVCATASHKSKDCGVGWRKCGSNTFPAGYFPACKSPLGVYDQHGNAAEHMNLPLARDQLSGGQSANGAEEKPDHSEVPGHSEKLGHTEMKGSWFVFDSVKAHEDHCRWRAPYWHGTRVMNPKSHRNYHLGFRCCKSLD